MSDTIAFSSLCLEVTDLFQHLAVFGQTGAGKTRYVLLPLLKEILALHADNPDRRAGAIIFDVKGDMPEHLNRVMRASGRKDDPIIIGRGGNAWFDAFAQIEADPRRVAESLMEIVESTNSSKGRSENESYWWENLRRFIQVASILARAIGSGRMGGVSGLAAAMKTLTEMRNFMGYAMEDEFAPSGQKILKLIRYNADHGLIDAAHAVMVLNYIENEVSGLGDRTWATIANYATSFISCLHDSDLAAICGPSSELPVRLIPEEIFDCGRVILVSLSRIHYGAMAGIYRSLIKVAFQDAALRRAATVRFDGKRCHPMNVTRPVLFVADEFGSLVTPGAGDTGDAFFLDKAREVRVACLLGMQGVSALNARFAHLSRLIHLLNNAVTKVFLANDCPETLAFFERSVPHKPAADVSSAWLPLPGYRHGSCALSAGGSRPKFDASVLRILDTGEAIVLRPKGFAERLQFSRFDDE